MAKKDIGFQAYGLRQAGEMIVGAKDPIKNFVAALTVQIDLDSYGPKQLPVQ